MMLWKFLALVAFSLLLAEINFFIFMLSKFSDEILPPIEERHICTWQKQRSVFYVQWNLAFLYKSLWHYYTEKSLPEKQKIIDFASHDHFEWVHSGSFNSVGIDVNYHSLYAITSYLSLLISHLMIILLRLLWLAVHFLKFLTLNFQRALEIQNQSCKSLVFPTNFKKAFLFRGTIIIICHLNFLFLITINNSSYLRNFREF
jgi:hypothetical protein